MRRLTVSSLVVLAIALGAASARPESAAGVDPRLVEAKGLLADRARYERAIELYREVLEEKPNHVEARLWLARVLSWKQEHDEALAQYARLSESGGAPPEVAIERAEVLSWAGRYGEAEAAFDAILAERPDDVRAWVGLARTHRWAGRTARAEKVYRRALELGADAEARAEWRALRNRFPHRLDSESGYYKDSDDFERFRSELGGSYQVDLATRVFTRAGWTRIEAGDALLAEHRDDRAPTLEVGFERRFTPGLRTLVTAGTRDWEHGPARLTGSAELEYTHSETLVLNAAVEHREQLDFSDSFLATQEGIVGVYPRLQFWKALGDRWESFGRVSFGSLSDHNRRLGAQASLAFRPWTDHDLHIDLGASALRYRDDSPFYYSPEDDLGARLGVSHKLSLGHRLAFEWRAGVGFGYTRELGESSSGSEFDVAAGLTWSWRRWRFEAGFGYGRSQRDSRYASRNARLSIAREF